MNLDYEESDFTKKKADYFVGSATSLADPMLHPRTQEYRRRLSGLMRPISDEDIFIIPRTTGYIATRKYDGEFALLFFDGKKIISINAGGTVRVGLPCFLEAVELLKKAKVKSAVMGSELYRKADNKGRNRVHDIIRILRNPRSEEALTEVHLAVFDVIEYNDDAVESVTDAYSLIDKWFKDGKNVQPAEHKKVDSLEAISKLFDQWVVKENSEGMVVRHNQAGWFKIKQRHNLDAAIIGFSEGSEERKDMLHDLLCAVMRRDGSFHELCRVGGGYTDEDRRSIVEWLRRRVVASDYIAVNNDYVAYEMVEPGPVIEISYLDVISENTKGGVINKTVLEFDGVKYLPLSRMPLVSVISPQFVRVREDKEANVEDVNISQVSDMFDVPDTEKSAHDAALKPSKIIERVVYIKTLKGQRMVRKLMLWKTNKSDTSNFPEYIVYLTDFSPNRQNPLERDMRVSRTEEDARELFAELSEKNFVKGWEKVS